MKLLKLTSLALAALLAVGTASVAEAQYVEVRPPGQGISRNELARAAHALENRANNLYSAIAEIEGYSHLADDARRFAIRAARFHDNIERGHGYSQVYNDFRAMQSEYHHLRSMFFRTHHQYYRRPLIREWARVAANFEVVALTMGVEDTMCGPGHAPGERPYPQRPYEPAPGYYQYPQQPYQPPVYRR